MEFLKSKILFLESTIKFKQRKDDCDFLLSEMTKIGIEKLPYAYTSLKKFIDSKTMDVHYNKHYKGYVEKLNKALSSYKDTNDDLESIIKSISKYNKKIRNNAGGAFNHALFWKMLSPKKQTISDEFSKILISNFGSIKKFENEFSEVAKDVFGSGWVWLIISKTGKLKIMSTPNQDNPLMNIVQKGGYPILGLDVWEHAYYLKYKNKRDEYIKNFWQVVNWNFVEKLYNQKTKKTSLIKESNQDKISLACSTEEKEKIKYIFNTNPQVVNIYRKAIDYILKEVFSEFWKERGQYMSNEISGIYDFEREGRSVLNKLNTNFTAFCLLFRDVNKVLKLENKPLLNLLNDKTQEEQIESTKQFVKKIYEYKNRIFSTTSPTFKGLMKILELKHQQGETTEKYVIPKLAIYFGKKNVIDTTKLGGVEDVYGTDCTIEINSEKYTAQIKPYKSVEKITIDGVEMYKVLKTGYVKNYTTDFLIFGEVGKKILIFKNKKTKIIDGIYHIPVDELLKEL